MKNLAFLMPASGRLRAFRFDTGYERRYGNRVLAMKTNNTAVRLLQLFLGHTEPRFQLDA